MDKAKERIPKTVAACQQLRAIRPGWYEDNQGKVIVPELIQTCEDVVRQLVIRDGMEEPALYPVENGSIDMVWVTRGTHCTLDADDNVLIVVTKPPPGMAPGPIAWGDITVQDFELPTRHADRVNFVCSTVLAYLQGRLGDVSSIRDATRASTARQLGFAGANIRK